MIVGQVRNMENFLINLWKGEVTEVPIGLQVKRETGLEKGLLPTNTSLSLNGGTGM